jgi:nucleotide-binding universal stress UspA family protein
VSIVLGYDESPGSRPALAVAISLALRYDEPLVLVYGVEPPGGVGEEFRAHQRALTEMGRTAVAHELLHLSDRPVHCVPAGEDLLR